MADKSAAELIDDLKLDLGDVLKVYNQQRFLAADSSLTVYSAWEKNWYQTPPAIIRVDGVVVSTGFDIDYGQGTVTFSVARDADEVVTAEFFFQPVSDSDLYSFVYRATLELSSLLHVTIDPTIIGDSFQVPVVDLAFGRALSRAMAGTVGYHRWISNGVEMNKDMVTRNYLMVVQDKRKTLETTIAAIRQDLLSGGLTVTPDV